MATSFPSQLDVFVLTSDVELTVETATELLTVGERREASVFVQRDVQSAVVRQSDVMEMNQ